MQARFKKLLLLSFFSCFSFLAVSCEDEPLLEPNQQGDIGGSYRRMTLPGADSLNNSHFIATPNNPEIF